MVNIFSGVVRRFYMQRARRYVADTSEVGSEVRPPFRPLPPRRKPGTWLFASPARGCCAVGADLMHGSHVKRPSPATGKFVSWPPRSESAPLRPLQGSGAWPRSARCTHSDSERPVFPTLMKSEGRRAPGAPIDVLAAQE